jgi:type VI secretion system protein ImpH
METESGQQSAAIASGNFGSEVEEDLRHDPWDFEFFQAVRLLARLTNGEPVGRFGNPANETVRFASNPTLAFPPSQIHSLEWPDAGQPKLSVNFFGLTGPLGPMPLPYTEFTNDRVRAHDHVFAEFLDLFHHRLLSLFYRAWEKYRFPVAFERDKDDHFTHHLLDLIGLGTDGLPGRQIVPDKSIIFYTGMLAQQSRSATALRQIVSDYFDVPAEIEEFVGAWHPLTQDDETRVGEERGFSEQLGKGVVAGDEVWDRQCGARVVLGPLTLAQYLDFLPSGTAYQSLCELVRFFSRREIDFRLRLILLRAETPPVLLDDEERSGILLGWNTWLKSAPMDRDPDETVLELQ